MFVYSPQCAIKSHVYPDYFLLLSFGRQDSTIASIGNLIIWKLLNAMGMGISRAPFPFKYIGFLAAPGCDEWTFVRDSPTKIYTLRRRVDIWRDGNQVIFFQKSGHLKHFALLLQLLLLKFTRFFHTIFTNTSSQISNTPDGNVKDEFACYIRSRSNFFGWPQLLQVFSLLRWE